jgi:glycogen(starch) synthase
MYLFEISWEVCNKVGGINTVLSSKSRYACSEFKKKYFTIGPYIKDKARGEFVQHSAPDFLKEAFERVKPLGILCRFGKWLVPGEPSTILIEYEGFSYRNDELKKRYWEEYGIDSLGSAYHDYDVPMVWSSAVGALLREVEKIVDEKIIAHCHEWLSAGTILYLKDLESKVKTIFTTHATMLGRALTGEGRELYNELDKLNPEEEAKKIGITAKHHTEKAAAEHSDIFSTVSEITAFEAEKLLGKKPDMILPNGIDESAKSVEELLIQHQLFRERIRHFITYCFFPYYSFDIEQSLTFYIAARYEFRGKGMDMLIDALSELNRKLTEDKSEKTIVVLFLVPAGGTIIKENIVENKEAFNDIVESIQPEKNDIINRLTRAIISKKRVCENVLLPKDVISELKKKLHAFKKSGRPELVTHYLPDEQNDAIVKKLKSCDLTNSESSKVKVVFYPTYLTGSDGLLNLNYSETIIGCHLGIFPSIYEPWGYTPVESAIRGVPAITTDLAGFGNFLIKEKLEDEGISVLRYFGKSYQDRVKELADSLYHFASLNRQKRIDYKIKARNTATKVSWKELIKNYFRAYEMLSGG